MATRTYGITTEARIKTRLQISAGVTTFDVSLKRLIYAVTDFLEKECGRRFQRATYTQELYDGGYYDGTSKSFLIVKNAPIVSISAFQYRTGSKSTPSWVDFQADTYQENLANGIIQTPLPKGLQNIRISYVGGYLIDFANEYDDALHTLPYDITELAEILVTRKFKKVDSEGRQSEGFRESQITWKELLEGVDKEVIANYRRQSLV